MIIYIFLFLILFFIFFRVKKSFADVKVSEQQTRMLLNDFEEKEEILDTFQENIDTLNEQYKSVFDSVPLNKQLKQMDEKTEGILKDLDTQMNNMIESEKKRLGISSSNIDQKKREIYDKAEELKETYDETVNEEIAENSEKHKNDFNKQKEKLDSQEKQLLENFNFEITSNVAKNREITENNIRTALVGGDIPYQIPLGGDNWCNHSGAVHQLVPGCGRICSDSEGYWVKDDPNRPNKIPWSYDLKSTCEGALLRTIWKPDPNNPNLRKLAVGEPSRSDYPRPENNMVPYLEHGISGLGKCNHAGSIVQAVPGCGLVCSDEQRVEIISPFNSNLNIGWDTWENNEKKIGCNAAKLGLIWGYTTDNNPKRRQFLLGDTEKNHATKKITQQERAYLCGTMALADNRGRDRGTTSLGQVARSIDWYASTQNNDPQFKRELYRRSFTYCGGLGNAQDIQRDCKEGKCIKPSGYRQNRDIRED